MAGKPKKGELYRVGDTPDAAGLLRLRAAPRGGLALAPGHYEVAVQRYGLGDPLVVGAAEDVAAGLVIGGAEVSAASRFTRRDDVDRLGRVTGTLKVDAGAETPLGLTLVVNRGKEPVQLREVIGAVLGTLPEGSLRAAVQALIGGELVKLGTALAMWLLVDTVDEVVRSLFGEHALLAETTAIRGAEDGARGLTLCFADLPDFGNVNVGERRGLSHFGVAPGDHEMVEKAGTWTGYPEHAAHPGWIRGPQPFTVVSISPAAAARA